MCARILPGGSISSSMAAQRRSGSNRRSSTALIWTRRRFYVPAACRARQSNACWAPRSPMRHRAMRTRLAPGEALLAFGPTLAQGAPAAVTVLNLSAHGDPIEAAANLFSHLRALDVSGAGTIAVMPIPIAGLGEAINDRLRRAAG